MLNNSEISILGRKIGPKHKPYVIAELSANHNVELQNAFSIIDQAKKIGADAVKIQTYRPDTITLKSNSQDFQISSGLWSGKTLYELYEQAHLPWEWHAPLFDYAKKVGITIFSSPFDSTAVDLLESLGTPAYKIASFEAVDLPLIRYVAKTGKPIIISTGLADDNEIQEAIDTAKLAGCKQIAILHCVSGYPAKPSDYNLSTIPDMIERFKCVTGLSDHTLGNTTAIAAVALGASIIEKHLTLNQNAGGPDDSFSLEPSQFKSLCSEALTAWRAKGTVDYGLKSSERSNVKFRRSLYFVKDLSAGDSISNDSIRSVRPGFGIAPKYLDKIIGKKLKIAVKKNTPVIFDILE